METCSGVRVATMDTPMPTTVTTPRASRTTPGPGPLTDDRDHHERAPVRSPMPIAGIRSPGVLLRRYPRWANTARRRPTAAVSHRETHAILLGEGTNGQGAKPSHRGPPL
jgi:hypothetical protein